ncbi:MAG TPA: hypothetical protein PKN88_07745 [Bacillota bacterium]|nr:hypothetical protein [Bacillota bacterium]
MSSNSFKCLLVMVITALYVVFFFFNCIIVPYPAVNDKYIAKTDRENISSIHICPDTPRPKPADEHVMASTGGDVQGGDSVCNISPQPDYSEEEAVPPGLDEADRDTRPSPEDPVKNGQPMPNSARQNESRVLLSGGSTLKAISSLSFKDKLWLVTILSRCSMEEFLKIMAMLEDGVTYQENLEMYRMLRGKVTDEEQERLDALIKSYTQ